MGPIDSVDVVIKKKLGIKTVISGFIILFEDFLVAQTLDGHSTKSSFHRGFPTLEAFFFVKLSEGVVNKRAVQCIGVREHKILGSHTQEL